MDHDVLRGTAHGVAHQRRLRRSARRTRSARLTTHTCRSRALRLAHQAMRHRALQYPRAVTLVFGGAPFVSDNPLFQDAFPYQEDVLALPVVDLDAAARWYSNAFGLRELERRDQPHSAVILERDGVKIGFALTG